MPDIIRTINDAGLKLIDSFETERLAAYDDAHPDKLLTANDIIDGTLTIGYGHTGPDVFIGLQISHEKALELQKYDLTACENTVANAVTADLNDNQFSALACFTFNIGIAAFKASTLLKLLNGGDYASVPQQMARWNKTHIAGQEVVSDGLTRRRMAEATLWATPISDLPQETQTSVTPSVPLKKKFLNSVTCVSGVVAAAGAPLIANAGDIANTIQPLIAYQDQIKYAFMGLTILAACTAAYTHKRSMDKGNT